MRARFHSPRLGRFLQRDPLGAWADAPNLGNAYAFVACDPWNRRDPFGLEGRGTDWLHEGLSWAGFIPGIGVGADLIDGTIYALEGEWTQAIAWLHDALEDSALTSNDLKEAGIDSVIINSVNLLTVYSSDNYMDKISFVKNDIMARKVKIADILSNLADSPTKKQIMKYASALQVLLFKHAN